MTTPAPLPEADASDSVAVDRIAGGDLAALGAIYDRYGRPAFVLARRITGASDLAQDVVHEVFMVLWRDPAGSGAVGGSLESWLLATTHRLAVEAVRREQGAGRRLPASAEEAARYQPRQPGGDPAGFGPRGHRAWQALHALPPPHRQALMLAYYAAYTQREIAEHTDTGLDTVRTRMVDGMRALRAQLHGACEAEGTRL